MGNAQLRGLALGLCLTLAGCSGGSNSGSVVGTSPAPSGTPDSGCTGSCATAQSFLTTDDVRRVIAQAVNEANAQATPAVIAVVDRVGNVLAVYRMSGSRVSVKVTSRRGVVGGLENLDVPSELAAIAKAITGAYLSSEGNAFSTRTASQIVQEHFNPGEQNSPAGPLFGVQFSQLPCSDLSTRFLSGAGVGPHRSPLGLSADPGGFPLYKAGTPVGGIGIAADDSYGLDANIFDHDRDLDELIAMAGTFGFGAPQDRRGDRITAGGLNFRFTDVEYAALARDPNSAPAFASLGAATGALMNVPGYSNGSVIDGRAFGQVNSGIRPDTTDYPGLDAFVLDDGAGNNRYPPRAGTDGANALTAAEVRAIEQQALLVANHARAQIRQPLGTQARVSVSIVDTNGVVLALARTRDAPIFGTDVSLQKARTAAFYSGAYAAADLQSLPQARYLNASLDLTNAKVDFSTVAQSSLANYVVRARAFLGLPNALGDGAIAFTDRAGGNLSRPFYPDGVNGTGSGPFSFPFAQWSPFQDGIQLDLVYNQVAGHLAFYLNQRGLALTLDGAPLAPAPSAATPVPVPDVTQNCTTLPRLANGIQIFPGSVPIYRGGQLIGGVGVSGDGVDQDDMVSFLGLHNAAALLGSISNAPSAIRSDTVNAQGILLRYVQCPQSPFIDSNDQNVCEGK